MPHSFPPLKFLSGCAVGFVAFEPKLCIGEVFSNAAAEVRPCKPQSIAIGSFNNYGTLKDAPGTFETDL
jgi:hypothetical protein